MFRASGFGIRGCRQTQALLDALGFRVWGSAFGELSGCRLLGLRMWQGKAEAFSLRLHVPFLYSLRIYSMDPKP